MACACKRSTLTWRDHGALGDHRLQHADPELGRLLGQEIDALTLDGREQEPEIGERRLGAQASFHAQPASALFRFGDDSAPFAVAAIEDEHRIAPPPAHDIEQIMTLLSRQREQGVRRQGRLDEKPGRRALTHVRFPPWLRKCARKPSPMPRPKTGSTAMRRRPFGPISGWRGSIVPSAPGFCCGHAGGAWRSQHLTPASAFRISC